MTKPEKRYSVEIKKRAIKGAIQGHKSINQETCEIGAISQRCSE